MRRTHPSSVLLVCLLTAALVGCGLESLDNGQSTQPDAESDALDANADLALPDAPSLPDECVSNIQCASGLCLDNVCQPCTGPEQCGTGICSDAGHCVECQLAADCSFGSACANNYCVDSNFVCESDTDCSPGLSCFAGECVDANSYHAPMSTGGGPAASADGHLVLRSVTGPGTLVHGRAESGTSSHLAGPVVPVYTRPTRWSGP